MKVSSNTNRSRILWWYEDGGKFFVLDTYGVMILSGALRGRGCSVCAVAQVHLLGTSGWWWWSCLPLRTSLPSLLEQTWPLGILCLCNGFHQCWKEAFQLIQCKNTSLDGYQHTTDWGKHFPEKEPSFRCVAEKFPLMAGRKIKSFWLVHL